MCFPFLFVFSPLVWFVLWLPEEVLPLLFLLHHENGDFSILMKDITAKSAIINGQFYMFLRLCSPKVFFVLRWSTYYSSEEKSLTVVDSVKEDWRVA